MKDVITMCFPAKMEYLAPIRLAVSGIAKNFDTGVERIENIKTCVQEACLLLICSQTCNVFHITVTVTDTDLTVEVHGAMTHKIEQCRGCREFNTEMSKMLITAMCREVKFLGAGDALSRIIFSIDY